MQVVILAAGKGSRMKELTLNCPKALILIKNKPILKHTLDSLPSEIDEIIIVIKYLGSKIKKYFGYKYKNIKIRYVVQNNIKGTAGALWSAKRILKNKFLVLNGDDFYKKSELKKIVKQNLAIGLVKTKPINRKYLCIKLNSNKEIIGWGYPTNSKNSFIINGSYVLNKEIFKKLPVKIEGDEFGLPQTILEMSKTTKITGLESRYWYSINSQSDIRFFEENA